MQEIITLSGIAQSDTLLQKFALLERAENWTAKAVQQTALACLNDLAASRSCQRIALARAQFPDAWRRVSAAMRPYLNGGLVVKGKAVKFVGNWQSLRDTVAELRTYVRENGCFPEQPKAMPRLRVSAYERIALEIRKNADTDKRIGVLLNALDLIESGALEF